jgi:hypothetical protein
MTTKQKVLKYFLQNPIDDNSPNKYKAVREKFNIDIKTISRYWIEFKGNLKYFDKIAPTNLSEREVKKILTQNGDNLSVTVNTDIEVKTLEDLLEVCEIDTDVWEVISWQCKKWDLGIKNQENQIETKQLYSVSAKFRPIKVENNLELQKKVILEELFLAAPSANQEKLYKGDYTVNKDNLLEIALFDVHFGKLAHREEVGEDYDLKIASKRYKDAVLDLLSRVNLDSVDRILLPVGQDLINVDNLQGTTTGGTPQDSDSRFHKIIKTVRKVLVETIDLLKQAAPVDVIISVGNHDEQSTFMIGEILDAYYTNDQSVSVYNDASLRKYYKYGVNAIMLTHGNREKFNDLGMIFAAENPKLWADTKYRFVQIGHFHHNKKVTTLQAQEFQGFQIQILPSISGSDAWHTGKGYNSLKQAKAFLYNKTKGLFGEYTHNAV